MQGLEASAFLLFRKARVLENVRRYRFLLSDMVLHKVLLCMKGEPDFSHSEICSLAEGVGKHACKIC